MNLGNMLTTAMNIESRRAYPNLFEVNIYRNTNSASIENIPIAATKLEFEDSFGFNMEHNDSIQSFMMAGVNRIKGVSITLKETKAYSSLGIIKGWMDSIYNFKDHYFYDNINPTGTIKVNLLQGGYIIINDAIPKSVSYPAYSWSESSPIEITASFSCGYISFSGTGKIFNEAQTYDATSAHPP